MNKISLSLKISFSFILVSMVTLAFFYTVFYHLFEKQMLKVEGEKAVLIARTIEPLIAMNHFLGLNDNVSQLAEKTAEHDQIENLSIEIENQIIWSLNNGDGLDYRDKDFISISYPITDLVKKKTIGSINIAYKKDALNNALQNIHNELLYYLTGLAFVFIVYVVFTRYLFSPFEEIAKRVKNYEPGSLIDFSLIRPEPEVDAIITSFKSMVSNIREYTVLLERYKHSFDESSIVVRMDLDGMITYVNEEFSRLSGYSLEESLGISVFVICHSEVDESQCNEILETVRARNTWKGNLQNGRKNGGAYYVRATVVPIFDEFDEIVELISIQQDITQVIEQQEKITRQTTDHITGLNNRVKLEEDIVQMEHPKFAIIALDNYGVIKDYYGQELANKILKEVADIFLSIASINNISAYKLSGGDYAVLADQSFDMDLFHGMCRALLKKINDYVIDLDDSVLHISASAGLTSNSDNYYSYAGLALQYAQETRHSTIIYEEAENLVQRFENNQIWTKKLNQALKENRIVLFVQPIFHAKSLTIEKYECLVRMVDEDASVISPSLFLDIAKKSKLYHQLTEKVITIAFDVFSTIPGVGFSINLTLEDVLHVATVEHLKSKLDETGLASRLMIEIVESEGIENFKEVSVFVADMKDRGCKIAIDDFGSGYSNFAYLMQLNIDCIKIDGSIIKSLGQDRHSQIITSTILDFSKQLEIDTVAEYVHDQAVLDYVKNMGIDYLQGFYLGEPVPIETLML